MSVFEPEIENGWMVKSDIPPFVPICVRPMSVVEKTKAVDGHLTVTGYRLVLGASFPKPKRKGGMVLNSAGLEVPLAPNENLAPNGNFDGLQPDLQYTSIGEITAAAQPLLSLAEFTGGTWAKPLTGSSGFDRYTCACSIDGS